MVRFAIETMGTNRRVVFASSGEDDDREIVVGRGKDCAFRAGEGDATVSRRHVAFRASRDGKLYCRDLGSTHGTRAGALDIGTEWTEVELGGDGATETVTCYLWDDTTRTAGEWSFQHFRAAHLAAYVEMCEAFREDVQNNDLPPEEEEAGE